MHVAHRLRAEFPDGRCHVDLAGMSGTPREPAMLLAELLAMLGIDEIPDGLTARAARFRSRLADRQVLLVLDYTANADQVRPLLPAEGGCAVVVTSRHTLPDLAGARHVKLDVLETADAHRLLATIAGQDRVAAEPDEARAIVRFCRQLPLALRIIGGRLAGRARAGRYGCCTSGWPTSPDGSPSCGPAAWSCGTASTSACGLCRSRHSGRSACSARSPSQHGRSNRCSTSPAPRGCWTSWWTRAWPG